MATTVHIGHRGGGSRSHGASHPRRRPVHRRAGIVATAVVVALIVTMLAVKLARPPSSNGDGATIAARSPLAPAGAFAVTHVPTSALDAVGTPAGVTPPQPVRGAASPLVADGKPSAVYIGAEFCPFCAAATWPLVIALSRFGTFSNLQATRSGAKDIFPGTATISFYGATYASRYLSFSSVELNSNQVVGTTYATLERPDATQAALLETFDVAPYTTTPGSIPFLDLGNRYLGIGASYSPQVLQGMNQSGIASELADPTTAVAQDADGSANYLTAALCRLTNDQPQTVCADRAVVLAKGKLG